MRFCSLVIISGLTGVACAQDSQLAALHVTLVNLHSHNKDTFGGTPELTTAKHQLRDWVETQLDSLKDVGDEQAFSNKINKALESASVAPPNDSQNLLGSLGSVTFRGELGLLLVTTAVGINCQYDESVYAYKLVNESWHRVWESEQNDYSEDNYAPQHIDEVHVWQRFKDGSMIGPAFVMTLGNAWGCASTWHPVFYRVWRVDASGSKLLIDGSQFAWLRAQKYIVGSIVQDWTRDNSPVDVVIEFTQMSVDAGVHNREAIRHYLIEGDHVRRVDPIALSPRDAVDEWLTRPWSESAAWSSSRVLRTWHKKLHSDSVFGDFLDVSMHCNALDLWQVSFEPTTIDGAGNSQPQPEVYFLIRWRPPYHFTVVDVSRNPWPRCTEKDPEADAWRTLFATQEWRY